MGLHKDKLRMLWLTAGRFAEKSEFAYTYTRDEWMKMFLEDALGVDITCKDCIHRKTSRKIYPCIDCDGKSLWKFNERELL